MAAFKQPQQAKQASEMADPADMRVHELMPALDGFISTTEQSSSMALTNEQKNWLLAMVDRISVFWNGEDADAQYVHENAEALAGRLHSISTLFESFLTEDEDRKLRDITQVLSGSGAVPVQLGLPSTHMGSEMQMPEQGRPVRMRISSPGDMAIEFNEKWLPLYGTEEAREAGENVAGRAAAASFAASINSGFEAEARSAGEAFYQDILDNVNAVTGAGLNSSQFAGGLWGDAAEFIRDRFGVPDADILRYLQMIRDGKAIDALEDLKEHYPNTPLAWTLEQSLAGGMNGSVTRFEVGGFDANASYRLFENRYAFLDIGLLIGLRAMRNYRMNAEFDGATNTFVFSGSPEVTTEAEVGGMVTLAGGVNVTPGRTLSVQWATGWAPEYQPQSAEEVGELYANRFDVAYADETGNPLGIPMGGKVYLALAASVELVGENVAEVTFDAATQLLLVTGEDFVLLGSVGAAVTWTPEAVGGEFTSTAAPWVVEGGLTAKFKFDEISTWFALTGGVTGQSDQYTGWQLGAQAGVREVDEEGRQVWSVSGFARITQQNVIWAPEFLLREYANLPGGGQEEVLGGEGGIRVEF
ncbi:MAG: hypothetical protein WC350_03165 [Candidatus Micrarchaeia archaeon]